MSQGGSAGRGDGNPPGAGTPRCRRGGLRRITMNIDQILFGAYPYIALPVLAVGSVVRFDREQYTWRSGSSQFLRRKQLIAGSDMIQLGVQTNFTGNFDGL